METPDLATWRFTVKSVLSILFVLLLGLPPAGAGETDASPFVLGDPLAGAFAPPPGHGARARFAPGHILVKLHRGTDSGLFFEHARGRGLVRRGRVYGTDWYTLSLPPGKGAAQAVSEALDLPGVQQATRDPLLTFAAALPPRDPFYRDDPDPDSDCDPLQETCDPLDQVDQWGLFKVGAEAAWAVTTGSPEVVIAVLDSGVDLDHDDLAANIWRNPGEIAGNGLDDDRNGLVDDVHGADFCGNNNGTPGESTATQDGDPDIPTGGTWIDDPFAYPYAYRFVGDPAVGDFVDNNFDGYIDPGVFHGTFVAGIIGAQTDNLNPDTGTYEGMAGVCWHCRLMPVRMINAEGGGYGSDAAAAVRYAADMGADIINASWGMPVDLSDPSQAAEVAVLTEAIDYAVQRGVLFVASAGNSGHQAPGVLYPANLPSTIAVGASDWLDRRSFFSSYSRGMEQPNGRDDDGNGWVDEDLVDVVAPGELIWSTYVLSAYDAILYELGGASGWQPGDDSYTAADGTSFSAPLVSGYLGLLLSQNPGLSLGQVRAILRQEALDLLDPNGTGASLPGYDPYSGFGRLRLRVPGDVPPDPPDDNQPPTADAGPDITVADTGKPGSEKVTLDGTASFDPDGSLVAYRWIANDTLLAAGPRVTLTLPVGVHLVTLSVSDDRGAIATDDLVLTITAKNGTTPPTAAFSVTCTDLTCAFDAGASSAAGTISAYDWDFGDQLSGQGETVAHTYLQAGTYTVTLTVTDDTGATDSVVQEVSPGTPAPADALELSGVRIKDLRGTAFEVTWRTNLPADSELYCSTTDQTFRVDEVERTHRISLISEKKGVYIEFCVRSTTPDGLAGEVCGLEYQF